MFVEVLTTNDKMHPRILTYDKSPYIHMQFKIIHHKIIYLLNNIKIVIISKITLTLYNLSPNQTSKFITIIIIIIIIIINKGL